MRITSDLRCTAAHVCAAVFCSAARRREGEWVESESSGAGSRQRVGQLGTTTAPRGARGLGVQGAPAVAEASLLAWVRTSIAAAAQPERPVGGCVMVDEGPRRWHVLRHPVRVEVEPQAVKS
eukprot:TRINITY_DN2357_c0_g1_i3.p3 TRINITY_DN2357_c0_g1~~TRINITY_DN2357_c0_g1_i3.p3  ORF type:complete len:122 (+),score=5.18 TRINITY_DN2357_c0_g1_i3:282-647(+)